MKRLVVTIVLSLFTKANGSELLSRPSLPTAPGETGHLFLNKNAVIFHPFTNDMGGFTDKFFTFGSYLGILNTYENFGHEHRLTWRMITPSFQDKKKVTKLRKVPIGRYADWLEVQSGFAYNFGNYGLAINYGLGKLGNNGAKKIQHWWHDQFDIKSNKRLKWDNQPFGYESSYGGEFRFGVKNNNITSLGYQKNILLEEFYIRNNFLLNVYDSLYSFEFLLARPLSSELNQNPKDRYEATVGGKFGWYTPSVRYTSPYIVGDVHPQIYYNLFNIQISY